MTDTGRVLGALAQVFALQRTTNTFLEFIQGLRCVLLELFPEFDYAVWFYDTFEDQRSSLFLSAYNSLDKEPVNRCLFSELTRTGPVAESFFQNKVIYLTNENDQFPVRLFSPISFNDNKSGVLGIFLNGPYSIDASTLTAVKYLGEFLFFALSSFFDSLEYRLFCDFRDSYLTRRSSYDDSLKVFLTTVKKYIACEGCSFFLYDPDAKRLSMEATTGLYGTEEGRFIYELGEGLTGWVAKHCRPLRIYNIDDTAEVSSIAEDLIWKSKFSEIPEAQSPDYEDWRSFMAVPVFLSPGNTKLLGVLRVSKRNYGDAFLPTEENLLKKFANSLTSYYIGYQNWCFREDMEFVSSIGRDLAAPQSDLKIILSKILEQMSVITNTRDGYIALAQPDGRSFPVYVSHGKPLEQRTEVKFLGEGLVGKAAESKNIICTNSLADRLLLGIDLPKENNEFGSVRSQIAIPLTFKESVIGIVNLHSPREDTFKPLHRTRLALIGNAAAVVTAYIQRYKSTSSQLEFVTRILRHLANLDLQRLYLSVMQESTKLLDADSAAILLFNKDKSRLCIEKIYNYAFLDDDLEVNIGHGVSGACFEKGTIVTWRKGIEGQPIKSIEVNPDLLSEIGIPISYGDQRLGCIIIASTENRFLNITDEIESLLLLSAQQIGLAITTARFVAEREAIDRVRNRVERSVTIGHFVTSIAHDFQNRLTGITGDLEFVEKFISPDLEVKGRNIRDIIKSIAHNVESLNDITSKLKRQRADVPYRIQDCYINDITRNAVSIMSSYATELKIEIELHLSETLNQPKQGKGHILAADFDSISRAVENIVKNAIEHSSSRQKIRIDTLLVRERHKHDYKISEIRITDYGEGMEDPIKARIFEPAFTTKSYGSGLGLFNAKGAIEAAGGHIKVESAPHKGTTFTLIFYLD